MKNSSFAIMALAAVFAVGSCQKGEELFQEESLKEPTNEITQGEAEVSAKAGIPGNKVKWVRLWENGPKFAEFNVGATSVTGYGDYYCWEKTTDDTATSRWGENWRMPTQAEFEALLTNCDSEWTTVGGVNGCKFTGKGDYKGNSVFFPAAGRRDYDERFPCSEDEDFEQGYRGFYWSSTPGIGLNAHYLFYDSDSQYVNQCTTVNYAYSVRAVLAK